MSTYGSQESGEKRAWWLRLLAACGPLLPSLITFLYPLLAIPLFTPRQVIDENNLSPFLLAIWASPTSSLAHLSRLLQAAFLWLHPISTLTCYQLWIYTAILRTGVGYILTRAVGWAHPKFFSHWALYETCGGYGPSLVAYVYIMGGTDVIKTLYPRSPKVWNLVVLAVGCALLSRLDNAPWTYCITILGAAAIVLADGLFHISVKRTVLNHPMSLDRQKQIPMPRFRTVVECAFLSLLAISIPYRLQDWNSVYIPTSMPPSPSLSSPLLEILILSYPRPNVTATTMIMNATISSYLPFLDSDVALSVFTHSASHPAFEHIRKSFTATNVTFYVDIDSHPEAVSGQYLHLGEAFRWVMGRSSQAEWVMLVEDDFPICDGERGWDAVKKVMTVLENGRSQGVQTLNKRGGFVGTGGSGLIIHRTTLPVLALLMHTHAEIASKLPPDAARRPADVVMQDCLLGTDPLCAGQGRLVITSRLVMDHIGGMATTNPQKALNSDKWRCGWRHPFHGRSQVDVVVV